MFAMSIGQRLASQHLAMEKPTLASCVSAKTTYPQTELIHWCHCKYPWCFFEFRASNRFFKPFGFVHDHATSQNVLPWSDATSKRLLLTLQLLHCSSDVGNYVGIIPTLPSSRFALYNTMQSSSESLTLFLRVPRLGGFLASNIWKD